MFYPYIYFIVIFIYLENSLFLYFSYKMFFTKFYAFYLFVHEVLNIF